MYFVTAMTDIEVFREPVDRVEYKERWNQHDKRCWGYFPTFEEAHSEVMTNDMDLDTPNYKYLVIEEIEPGIHSFTKHEWWYKWTEHRWEPIEQPAETKRIVNHAIG